jgi:hypothetical protein
MKAINGRTFDAKGIHEFDDRLGEVTGFGTINAERI